MDYKERYEEREAMREDTKWIVDAVEAVGKTALRDGEYWRATYTEEDAKAVELLKSYMTESGMEVYFDAVGNLFGRLPGKDSQVIMTGSHRDTVRHGGKYDGMLGILTGLKAAASLYGQLGKPEKTVEVVAICEEESSRFPLSSYAGSCHISGQLQEEDLQVTDGDGISMREAMEKAGYLREALSAGRKDLEHFVELHIEQGGLLEDQEKQVGIVTSIVGLFAGEVIFTGHQNHAGTTPMYLRKDPMPLAAEYIYRLHQWAGGYMEDLVCTVGKITAQPGNANVIPAEVSFTFDIRSAKEERLRQAEAVLLQLKKELEGNIAVEVRVACNEPPVQLDESGIEQLEKIAERRNLRFQKMTSGAGHDSQVIGQKYRTNMIFVPSVDGVSHSTAEFTKAEDIDAGYLVLRDYLETLAWQREGKTCDEEK